LASARFNGKGQFRNWLAIWLPTYIEPMVRGRGKKSRASDAKLARLYVLRNEPLTAETTLELRCCLADPSSLIVAEAAKILTDPGAAGLFDDLAAAFDRLMIEPEMSRMPLGRSVGMGSYKCSRSHTAVPSASMVTAQTRYGPQRSEIFTSSPARGGDSRSASRTNMSVSARVRTVSRK
jgi:hypothetical protein